VRDAEARVVAGVNLELAGVTEPVTGMLVSIPLSDGRGLNRLFLRAGRLPDAQRSDEVVVGESFATANGLAPGDDLVALINGRRQLLRIVGVGLSPEFVYQIKPGDLFPDFERYGVLWMAQAPLVAAFDLDGAFNDLDLTLYRDAREPDVIDALDSLLARTFHEYGR
jgi:putative ABC transport system permease protein